MEAKTDAAISPAPTPNPPAETGKEPNASSNAQANPTAPPGAPASGATAVGQSTNPVAQQVQQPAVAKKPSNETNNMPTRQYLDQTVAPVLLHGMQALARERPTDPIQFLASYLLKHSNGCDENNAAAVDNNS
ncbi:protein dpy-30 homolog [Drosophila teissieri]|uniref:protein dpy-30 homolog n=1 Tax=Drosophila teissieri TaxID=7243 RepID=UPI001CB9F564|nr:protein dpy-30 homolog [Drosophila teissieri]